MSASKLNPPLSLVACSTGHPYSLSFGAFAEITANLLIAAPELLIQALTLHRCVRVTSTNLS